MRAAAHDHDVVGVLELGAAAPHAPGAEQVTHGRHPRRAPSIPTGPPPRLPAASATTVHMYSPSAAPKSISQRSSASRRIAPGVRATETGRKPCTGVTSGRRSSAVKRANSSRRERSRDRDRGERGGHVHDVPPSAPRRARAARGAASGSQRTSARSGVTGTTRRRRAAWRRAELGQAVRRRACTRPCRGASGRRSRPSTAALALGSRRRSDGHVPAVAQLEPRAGRERLALHRAARERRRRRRQELEAHERSTSPSGS